MVHIIWRDLLRWSDTMETTQAVSHLADICIQHSVTFLHQTLVQKHGQPIGFESQEEQHLYVIGMGKLGAYELNRSEEHTSELQSRPHLVCRLLLEKKKKKKK